MRWENNMRVLLIGLGVTSGLVAVAGTFLGAIILADTAFGGVEGQRKLQQFAERHPTVFRLIGLIQPDSEVTSPAR